MLSPKIIYLKTAPPPEIELLLFDAESENHIPENSLPPPEIELLLFDADSENHIPENSPPPQIEILTSDVDNRYEGSQRGDFYCLWRLIWPGGQCFIAPLKTKTFV